MKIAIGSAFRNSAGRHISRYMNQVDNLHSYLNTLGWQLRIIAVEGDSTDRTRQELTTFGQGLGIPFELVTRNHGKKVFGSTEEPERMKALSYVGNGILESVREEDDALIYVESDLLWSPTTMVSLLQKLGPGIDCISPLIFAGQAFYDIWAFRKNGHRFGPFHPFHGDLKFDEPTACDSTGSCLVMKGEVARACRIIDDEALVGFGRDVWAKGFTLYCDARERIFHP